MIKTSRLPAARDDPPAGRSHATAAGIVASYFSRPAYQMLGKQQRLIQALLDAVLDGALKPGDQLPPELDLSRAVGVSLGTTQRALGGLARRGMIERLHGRGTFISHNHIAEEELWHFRFFAHAGSEHYLPVLTRSIAARVTHEEGAWTAYLGGTGASHVEIVREMDLDGRCTCLSRIYLDAGRFGAVLPPGSADLETTNIKLLLRQVYGVTYASVDQCMRFTQLNAEDAVMTASTPGETAIVFVVIGYESDGTPISFHEITIPKCELLMDLSFSGMPVRFRRPEGST